MGDLSTRLKKLRIEHEWSQETVARKIETTLRTYCRYEVEGADPKLSLVIKLADLYGVSLDYLAGRTDDPHFESRGSQKEI